MNIMNLRTEKISYIRNTNISKYGLIETFDTNFENSDKHMPEIKSK